MDEEFRRGAIGDRPARRLAAAAHAHPARLHQHVERALGDRDAADLLDVGARHRLVIGDDGERLDRRARQLALLLVLARQQPGKIGRGAERPAAGDAHEIDAALGVVALQLGHHRADVGFRRQPRGDRRLVGRLGGGEHHRLGDAQILGGEARRRVGLEQFGDDPHHWRPQLGWPGAAIATGRTPQRREGRVLPQFDLSLAHHLERGGKGGCARRAAKLRLDPVVDQPRSSSVQSQTPPISRVSASRASASDQTSARLEAHAGARVLLGLPRVGRQQIVERRLVDDRARARDRLGLAAGEDVAAELRTGEQRLAGAADLLEPAQPLRERVGELGRLAALGLGSARAAAGAT